MITLRKMCLLLPCFLTLGCGRQIQQNSIEDFEQAVGKGLKVERSPSTGVVAMHLTQETQSIFRAFAFEESPETLHRIEFDTNIQPVLEGDLKELCFNSISQYQKSFAIPSMDSLSFHREKVLNKNLSYVSFTRKLDGLAVKNAFFDCYFWNGGSGFQLREIVNDAYFHLTVREASDFDHEDLTEALSLLPGEIVGVEDQFMAADGELTRVSKVSYRTEDGLFTLYIQQGTGAIIEGAPHKLHIDQQIKVQIYPRSYLDLQLQMQTLPLTSVFTSTGATSTDVNGYVAGAVGGLQLASPRVNIYEGRASAPVIINETANDGKILLDTNHPSFVALNSYGSIHRLNQYVRQYLSPQQVPFLDSLVHVRVNQEGQCNAYYTTGTAEISLLKAGSGCANIGLVSDVIYHEWGHALDDHTGRDVGVTDGAFSEGIGDIVSAYYNNDPAIGVGFIQGGDFGIRRIDRLRTYPRYVGEVHVEGGIIGSAFWLLHEELVQRLGETQGRDHAARLFFQHLLTTDTYLESYQSLLRLDDDDGNPSTPSPNFCLINEVFAIHGLAEGVDCVDTPYQQQPSDTSMNLAIYDLAADRVGLAASTFEDGEIYLCFGGEQECLQGGRTHLTLNYVDGSDETSFYQYQGVLSLSGIDYVTLIRKDSDESVLGVRVFKLYTK